MLLILLGLTGLWLGTKSIITGALGMAKRFNLSHSFVGVAILAVGTDLPEVFVSVNAAILQLNGIESSGIITGNAIGSSFCQITFILGVAGLLLNFKMPKMELWRDGIALVISVVLLFVFGIDGIVSRLEGSFLLMMYLLYYLILVKTKTENSDDNSKGKDYSSGALLLLLFSGFFTLIFSSHLVVNNAMALAEKWGISQSFVGIAIIGLGTSLPELAVSVGAAINKSSGMSMGNIIGSNIFDGFIPIGLGSLISTTKMEGSLLKFDLPVLLAVTILVLVFLKTKRGISIPEGIILIVVYLLYIVVKLIFFEGN